MLCPRYGMARRVPPWQRSFAVTHAEKRIPFYYSLWYCHWRVMAMLLLRYPKWHRQHRGTHR